MPCSSEDGPTAGVSPCRSAPDGLRYRPPDRDVEAAAYVPSSEKENRAMPGSRMDRAAMDGDAHGTSLAFSRGHTSRRPSASIKNSRTLSGAMVPLFVLGMILIVHGQEEQARQPPERMPAQVAVETLDAQGSTIRWSNIGPVAEPRSSSWRQGSSRTNRPWPLALTPHWRSSMPWPTAQRPTLCRSSSFSMMGTSAGLMRSG